MKTIIVFSEDFRSKEVAQNKADGLRYNGCKKVTISKGWKEGWWHVEGRK